MPGPGQSAPRARLLHPRAHLPAMSGPRPVDRQSVRILLRLRPRHPRAHAVGEHPSRCRGRHPHPPCRRGRGRCARRSAGRPLHLPVDGGASVLPARGCRSALPRAGLDGHGSDGRRFRSSDDRRRQNQGESAGRHAVRPPVPAVRKRYAGASHPPDAATCTCRSWSKPRKT